MNNCWQDIKPGDDGARRMGAQMTLDRRGTTVLAAWFERMFGARVVEVRNLRAQKRGADLAVHHPLRRARARHVSVDLKADTHLSGNLTLELLSQDRPNSHQPEPVAGWPAKDMALVAQLLLQTGELVVMDTSQMWPWLVSQVHVVLEEELERFDVEGAWCAGTPNPGYISYNLMLPLTSLLRECPGCLYFRVTDVLESGFVEQHTGYALCPPLVRQPALSPQESKARLEEHLLTLPDYVPKTPLGDAHLKERLVRWLERRARFSTQPGVRAKGLALQRSRQGSSSGVA